MSQDSKTPLATIESIAKLLTSRFEPYCQRIEIAGSIRRRKPMCGDIEIVAIPTIERGFMKSLFSNTPDQPIQDRNLLIEYIDQLVEQGKIRPKLNKHGNPASWGSKSRRFLLDTKRHGTFTVDLFMCEPSNWGNTLWMRTGSNDFNKAIVTHSPQGFMPSDMVHKEGWLWQRGKRIACPEEANFFAALGLPYIEPHQRSNRHDWQQVINNNLQAV